MTTEAQAVDDALAAYGAAVVARLRAAADAKGWVDPPRVTIETRTKVRPGGAATTVNVSFDLPDVSVRIERGFGASSERLVTKVRERDDEVRTVR